MDLNSDRRHFIPAVFPPMTEKPIEEFSYADLLQNEEDHEVCAHSFIAILVCLTSSTSYKRS
jgi:hypothetical protein